MNNESRLLYVFDFDDTLVKNNNPIIKVTDKRNGKSQKVTTHQFSKYDKNPNYISDFSAVESDEYLDTCKKISWVWEIIDEIRGSVLIGIVTARSDVSVVHKYMERNGIYINKNFVIGVGDPPEGEPLEYNQSTVPLRKKAAFKDFIDMGFNSFVYFEDNLKNIEGVKELENEEFVKIETIHVK